MSEHPQPPGDGPEPLDGSERELARLLRSLPGGAPSPQLDARILAAGRNAVQPKLRKVNRWRSLGLGTAASALLAVGVFLRVHHDERAAIHLPAQTTEASTDRSPEARSVALPAAAAAKESNLGTTANSRTRDEAMPPPAKPAPPAANVSAAMVKPEAATTDSEGNTEHAAAGQGAFMTRPSAFPAPAEAEPATRAIPSPPAPPPSPPAPPPPAPVTQPPAPTIGADRAAETGALDARETSRAPPASTSLRATPPTPANAGTAAAADSMRTEPGRQQGDALNRPSVKSTDEAKRRLGQPVPGDDASLAPSAWLDRIRARLAVGDRDGARASLRRFHEHYPDTAIPDDLRVLLP